MHFGGQRPGCWINFIPAGGLLLVPEASSGCQCPFAIATTIVFKPTDKHKGWAVYSAPGPTTPVKRLAINLGAKGDRKDTAGNMWFGYPRPADQPRPRMMAWSPEKRWPSLLLKFKLETTFQPGGEFVGRNSFYTKTAQTDIPWLFACEAQGLTRCVVPLRKQADGTAMYHVRLAFVEPENKQPGERVFSVYLQGKEVLKDFDIVKEAGGSNRALVKEFRSIPVKDNLHIELKASKGLTLLCGLEIIMEDSLTVAKSKVDARAVGNDN